MSAGTQLKLAGLERAASHHSADLQRAQLIAELMAGMGRLVTADDVRELFAEQHGRPLEIGNAMGSLFANKKKWQCVGHVRSKRTDARARWLSQWQLRTAYRPTPVAPEVGIENGVRFCLTCNHATEECTCQM